MKFESLDIKMRLFETSLDQIIIPEVFIVARLDGRGFTRLTKKVMNLDKPFDIRFRDAMVETTSALMDCGCGVQYGYTQSDEISLLLKKDDQSFGRKTRKLISILAGEASVRFSSALQTTGIFDCRIIALPNEDLVTDYFRWRAEDASRNALNAYCYWQWRAEGKTASEASHLLKGLSTTAKNDMLFQQGINYNNIPAWQKRGIGLYYETYMKESYNPITGKDTSAIRRKLNRNFELPMSNDYSMFLKQVLESKN